MSSSKTFRLRTLIAVFTVVMAAVMWPTPTTAQYPYPEGCGYCLEDVLDLELGLHHRFPGWGGFFFRCNTNKGCHGLWYPDRCGKEHSGCYIFMQVDDIESAVLEGDLPKLRELLASSDNWDYDPTSHALSFTCSGYTVARYVLPEDLRHGGHLLPTNDRTDTRLQESDTATPGPRS